MNYSAAITPQEITTLLSLFFSLPENFLPGQLFGRKITVHAPEDVLNDLCVTQVLPRALNELVLSYVPVDEELRTLLRKDPQLPASKKAAFDRIAHTVEELDLQNA